MAIATGSAAGIWVLDVDGEEGETTLAALVGRHGALPRTVEARTGGGGRHLFFGYPSGRSVRNSVRRLGPGLDTRSDGGLVVAPPSRHASGRFYEWLAGRSPDDTEVAPAPAWLYGEMDAAERCGREARGATGLPAPVVGTMDAYSSAALEGEVLSVLRAREGVRNETLHTAAVKLGSLVGAGALDRRQVEHDLTKAALACGLHLHEAAATLLRGLEYGIANPRKFDATRPGDRRRAANVEAQAIRRKRLRDNPAAIEWLTVELGLDEETVGHFGFGLDKPYESARTGKVHADALTFPLRGADGRPLALICKADVPGVTQHPAAAWWAAAKDDATFHARPDAGQRSVVVCDMPDLWCLWQALRRDDAHADLQLVASTGFATFPDEWSTAEFWDAWETVYVATPADARGSRLADLVHRAATKPVLRMPPPTANWRQALAAGAGPAGIAAAMAGATVVGETFEQREEGHGRRAYRPLDIGRAFHNGHLYYPVDTLLRAMETDRDGSVREVERVETVVIRSDGRLLHAMEMPAPKGTPLDKRVMRLSDGTLIDGPPKAPAHPSWSWSSTASWLADKEAGRETVHRPFAELLDSLRDSFRRAVWLPYEEDHLVLALTCAASYCQAVFQAVPLVLLCGEAGSGKSTAGILTSSLSANGTIVGQVNAAAAARLIHETKGLVVLDDLEAIGAKAGKDSGSFGELVQWLKVSYNRDTATKVWVDASRNFKVERLNGFGIKVINNTTGVDGILGSRMLRVQTRRMPEVQAKARRGLPPVSADDARRLRDELHAWTFDNVAEIAAVYAEVCPSATERSEEIAAPLRVLARISGRPEHAATLEAALARTRNATFDPETPAEVLVEAATLLARQGFREISPTHVILEMKRLVDAHFGQTNTTEIPEYQQPEWVGRMLRLRDILEPGEPGYRKRFFGRNLRIYPFSRNFLSETVDEATEPPAKGPTDFCKGCEGCPYRSHGCPLMEERIATERMRGAGR